MAPDDAPRRAVKLIIDTDPGVDDAYAIALAMHTMRDDVKPHITRPSVHQGTDDS